MGSRGGVDYRAPECLGGDDARQWLANLIATLKHEEQVLVFVTLWSIWHARRKAIHEQIYQSPLTVRLFVDRFIADLSQINLTKVRNQTLAARPTEGGWIPPPSGWIKISVDAAIGKNTGRGLVAAVARDEMDAFVGASSLVFLGRTDAETLEALTCREVCALARDINTRKEIGRAHV